MARVFYKKEGINSEETLAPRSKVHFIQNYHGSCFHDEVKTSLPYWYGRIDSFLTKVNPNLYFKVIEDEYVILLLYVNNLSLTGNEKQIVECKKKLAEEF